MTLSAEQIRSIQGLEHGWRDAWGQLVEELLPLMERKLRWMFPRVQVEILEDVRSKILLEYQKSAESSRILANFGPEFGNPVGWLLGSVFEMKARGHLKGIGHGRIPEVASDVIAQGRETGSATDLLPRLQRLVFRFPRRGFTRPVQYAGLQLFPCLDLTEPRMQDFYRALLSGVRENISVKNDDAARAWLEAQHTERRRLFESRLAVLYDRCDRSRFESQETYRKARMKIDRLSIEMALFPLPHATVTFALHVIENNAVQIRHRYRTQEFLRALVPQIDDLFRMNTDSETGLDMTAFEQDEEEADD